MSEALMIEKQGTIATVTLTRPKAFNSFNEEMRVAMREAVEEIDADADIRVVILKGEGPGFCAGADLKEGFPADVQVQLEQDYRPSLEGIGKSPKIWISQVHGAAAGIGAAYAMNCDLMVMGESAQIYMAFGAIGLVPDGGNALFLLQALGYKRAMQAILEGTKISAAECREFGIANDVVPDADLEQTTRAMAERIAATAPLAAKEVKEILRGAVDEDWAKTFSHEAKSQGMLTRTEDFREGVAAFFGKRKAEFKGR